MQSCPLKVSQIQGKEIKGRTLLCAGPTISDRPLWRCSGRDCMIPGPVYRTTTPEIKEKEERITPKETCGIIIKGNQGS